MILLAPLNDGPTPEAAAVLTRWCLAERARQARGGIERALAETAWPWSPRLSGLLDALVVIEELEHR